MKEKILNISEQGLFVYLKNDYEKGLFFIYHKDCVNFPTSCRVQIGSYLVNPDMIIEQGVYTSVGFKFSNLNLDLVRQFWNILETKLHIKDKTSIHETNVKDAIIFKLSPFWLSTKTHAQFLTLFMRCAVVFYKKEGFFWSAIQKYDLSNSIFPTIEWFLLGNTKVIKELSQIDKDGFLGLISNYKDLNIEQIQERLAAP